MVSFISLITQRVYCELQAHSRFLSAMDIHPWRDVFATVAEDSTVGVWTLPREGSGGGGGESGAAAEPGAGAAEVQCVFATCWRDSMLTGVTFCGDRGDSLAVCAHDELELCVWQ